MLFSEIFKRARGGRRVGMTEMVKEGRVRIHSCEEDQEEEGEEAGKEREG